MILLYRSAGGQNHELLSCHYKEKLCQVWVHFPLFLQSRVYNYDLLSCQHQGKIARLLLFNFSLFPALKCVYNLQSLWLISIKEQFVSVYSSAWHNIFTIIMEILFPSLVQSNIKYLLWIVWMALSMNTMCFLFLFVCIRALVLDTLFSPNIVTNGRNLGHYSRK